MGQGSSYFTEKEEQEILAQSNISPQYLLEIQKRYSELDSTKTRDETSGVSIDEVLDIPEVRTNKLATILAEKYGGRTRIMFPRDFVDFFCALSTQRDPKDKVEILFNVLDVKKFGYLGPIEMYRFYHLLLSPSMNDQKIEQITKNLVNQVGEKIDLKKFRDIMPAWQIAEKMTVELQRSS